MTKKWITLAVLVSILGVPFAISAPAKAPTGRDLPILRNYFLRHYVETFIDMHFRGGRGFLTRGDMIMMDRLVSEWVDGYLIELSGRLRTLQTEFRAGQRFREHSLNQASDAQNRSSARARWKYSIAKVEDQAGEIRGMLRPILRGLKSKNKFNVEIKDGSEGAGFQGEMAF